MKKLTTIFACLFIFTVSQAQLGDIETKSEKLDLQLNENTLTSTMTFEDDNYHWVQFAFSEFTFRNGTKFKIFQHGTDYELIFDSLSIQTYGFRSCFFSPGTFTFSVYREDGSEFSGNVVGKTITYGRTDNLKSQCGSADNRVASGDVRVARAMPVGCTAWLFSNGTVATAGHCFEPNGQPYSTNFITFIEFDVPLSSPGGATNPSAPEDQFPVIATSVEQELGNNCGQDWALFTVGDNATTGNNVFMDRGDFFRPTRVTPAATLRITGHGVDTGTANQTQQTHSGPYGGQWNNGANGHYYGYTIDTEGGNSGSPIIRNSNQDFAYGIHTNGGCGNAATGCGNGFNSGQAFDYNPLEIEMNDFFSVRTIHVDLISNTATENGSAFAPFDTLEEAETDIGSSTLQHNIILVRGTYNETDGLLLDKSMLIHAPVGNVLVR